MKKITFGSRELNKLIDDTLMNKYSFPSETLMEIAGLTIAHLTHSLLQQSNLNNICVLVGPGNNGGDGLVAARHLKLMNYNVSLVTFKKLEGKNGIYQSLCESHQIPCKFAPTDFGGEPEQQQTQNNFTAFLKGQDLILDGIFGFPFTGEIRQPYRHFISKLSEVQEKILAIDIPSGWDANDGNVHNIFVPKYLISLSVPKQCTQKFEGEHYVGGRFIPEKVRKQLGIELPEYKGNELYTKI